MCDYFCSMTDETFSLTIPGYSCKLLNQNMDLIIVNESSLDVSFKSNLMVNYHGFIKCNVKKTANEP